MTDKAAFQNVFSAFYVKHEYAFVLSLVLIWQISLIAVSSSFFLEMDNYTHALRLMDFIQSGSWREILYQHDNCPFGQILHFTRITDMFLYLTTLPFLPFMELKQAILFGGFLYNPVMACLSAAALVWASRAFCSPVIRLTGILSYFFILPQIPYLFSAGRPDHHVLLNLFLILLSGCLTYGAKTQKTAYYKLAGLCAGLAVWTSPEGFLACLFLFAGMSIAWLTRCQNIRQIRLFSQFLFITTALCWLVNPPMQGVFHPDNGRLSVLTAAIFGFSFLSFYIEEFLEKELFFTSFWKRFGSFFFCAFLSFCFVLFIFGKNTVFSAPIRPELYEIWAQYITELQPAKLKNTIPFFGIFFISVFSYFPASLRLKKLLIIFSVPMLSFLTMMAISSRFSRPCGVFSIFTLIYALQILSASPPLSERIHSIIKKSWIIFLIIIYVTGIQFFYKQQIFFQKNVTDPKEYLPYMPSASGCILTSSDRGPETAWATGGSVIGSPYHSNAQGIIDNYTILTNEDLLKVPLLLKKRHISTILLDNPEYYPVRYGQQKKEKVVMRTKTFAQRLFYKQERWCFIREADAPKEIQEKYLIFSVDFNECEKLKELDR